MRSNEQWMLPAEGLWGFAHCAFYDSWYPWSGLTFEDRLERLVADIVSSARTPSALTSTGTRWSLFWAWGSPGHRT